MGMRTLGEEDDVARPEAGRLHAVGQDDDRARDDVDGFAEIVEPVELPGRAFPDERRGRAVLAPRHLALRASGLPPLIQLGSIGEERSGRSCRDATMNGLAMTSFSPETVLV